MQSVQSKDTSLANIWQDLQNILRLQLTLGSFSIKAGLWFVKAPTIIKPFLLRLQNLKLECSAHRIYSVVPILIP